MDIHVRDNKLRKALENPAECNRQYGKDMARKLDLRIVALRAADSLGVFWPPESGPERLHELKGDHAGIFSIDLKQPYRLLFEPIEEDAPVDRSDEQKRWLSIKAIEILTIEDTHG